MEFGLLNTVQSAIILFLDLYVWVKAGRENRASGKQRFFIWMAALVSLEQLLSLLVRMVKTKLIYCGIALQYVIYVAMFITMVLTAWGAMRYLLYLGGLDEKQTTARRVIGFLPCIVMSVSALASPWTHWLFYIDASLVYHRGSVFFLQLICPYVYAIAALVMIIAMYFRGKDSSRVFRYFLCFIVPTVAGAVLQVALNVDGGYSAIGTSVCLILLYLEFYIDEVRELEKLKNERSREELIRNNARLFSLEDEFECLYDVNLETGEYDSFDRGDFYQRNVGEKIVTHESFFENIRENIERVVYEEDREGVFEVQRKENIVKGLAENDHIDHYYRIVVENRPVWLKLRIVYRDEAKKNVIIGIFNAESSVEAKQIAEQKEKLEESLTFTDYFLNTYVSAYYVDLETRRFTVYKGSETGLGKESLDNAGDYLKPLTSFFRQTVSPGDADELISLIQPEKIKELIGKGEFSHYFRETASGAERVMRMHIIRGADRNHAALGFADVTEAYREQQKHLLGAMPLSNDVLAKANIGLWSFELDEGRPPRMYDDETMLSLVGLDHQVPPEEAYHAWYDNIDDGSYDLVADAVAKMAAGEHAEVQFPWHYPDSRTIMVRCGGVRNYGYTKGIRIEGTHQDVTQTLHFDEEERRRAKQLENDLIMAKLRADSLAFVSDNEPDLDSAISFFGNRIIGIFGCDQVVFRETNGRRVVLNAPGIEDIPQEICSQCPFSTFDSGLYGEDGIVVMDDCREGWRGVMTDPGCPAKSSLMQHIYSGGELVGMFAIHYLNEQRAFSENRIEIMKAVAIYLGLMLGRIKEKQAEIARIEAESSNKAKTEFLFNMSHDIRTPMNAILGYTDIGLRHADDEERSRDSFKKIKTAGGHLLNLINDILEMSRIESGALELDESPVDIRQSIDGITQMSYALAMSKDIDFKVEYGEIRNPYIYADELHANEIVVNLISNAIKYTPAGGWVRYYIEQISDVADGVVRYRFSVSDNGIGMSEEFQRHLFEAFSREKTSTVSKQEGAGLGLSIVKKIVDIAGGTISVKSRPDEGSTFNIELPFRIMDAAAIEAFKAENQPDDAIEEDQSLEGRKVLLVEDNEMNREIATEILEETGLLVDTAEDGEVALKTVMEKGTDHYDFILMDIQMPVMNGHEATKAIRSLPGGEKVPIIALSANAFEEDRRKSLAAGMNAHIAKPIDIKVLLETLHGFQK